MTNSQEELENFPFPLFVDFKEVYDYRLNKKLPLELFLRHNGFSNKNKFRVGLLNLF